MKQTSVKKMVKGRATNGHTEDTYKFHYEIQSKIHITVDLTF